MSQHLSSVSARKLGVAFDDRKEKAGIGAGLIDLLCTLQIDGVLELCHLAIVMLTVNPLRIVSEENIETVPELLRHEGRINARIRPIVA